MKIDFNVSDQIAIKPTFADLNVGDVFSVNSALFMKTELVKRGTEYTIASNAINLANGHHTYFAVSHNSFLLRDLAVLKVNGD